MPVAPDDRAEVRGLLVRLARAGAPSLLSSHARDGLGVIAATHARSVVMPRARRPLRRLGEHALSLALVEGRLVVALELDVGEAPRDEPSLAPRTAGLLLETEGRTLLLSGVRLVALGSFAASGPGVVRAMDADVPVIDVDAVLGAVEALAWATGGASGPETPSDPPQPQTEDRP